MSGDSYKLKRILMAGTAVALFMGYSTPSLAQAAFTINGVDDSLPSSVTGNPAVLFKTDNVLTVGDTFDINGIVQTDVEGGGGTLTFLGTSTVSDTVGSTGGSSLSEINISGGSGKIVTFDGNVYSDLINVVGSSTVYFGGTVGGNINLGTSANSLVVLENNADVNGSIYSNAEGLGTLTIQGSSDISGTVGMPLSGGGGETYFNLINVGADGSTSNFNNSVKVNNINLTGTGTVNFNGSLEVVSGDIVFGAAGTVSFNNAVKISDGTGVVDFADNDGTLILNGGVTTFDSNIDNTSAILTVGTVRVKGDTTVSGNLGSTKALKTLEAGYAGKTTAFTGNVNVSAFNVMETGTVEFSSSLTADTITYKGAGTVIIDSGTTLSLTGDIDFDGNNGTLQIGAGNNLLENVDNTGDLVAGTLTLDGGVQVITGIIGATNALVAVNTGNDASITTFANTINANTVNINGTGNVTFQEGITGDLYFSGNGDATISSGKSIIGDVDSSVDNQGDLILAGGAQTVDGSIGATHSIATITSTANNADIDLLGNVSAGTIDVSGSTASLNITGTLTGSELTVSGDDSTLTISKAVNVTDVNLEGLNVVATFSQGVTATTFDATQNNADINFNGATTITTFNSTGSGSSIDFKQGAKANINTLTVSGTSVVLNFGDTLDTGNFTSTGASADIDFNDAVIATGNIIISGNSSNVNFADTVRATGNIIISGTGDITGDTVSFANTVNAAILSVSGANYNVDFTEAVTATTVNVAENGGTADFLSTVSATNINILGTGAVTFAHDVTGNVNFTDGDGTVTASSGVDITGSVTSSNNGTGQITFLGAGSVSGNVGDNVNYINRITAGAVNNDVTFTGDVYANDVNLAGNSKVNFGSDLYSVDIDVAGSGTVNVADDLNTTSLDLNGTSTFTVNGDVTAADINLNAAAKLILNGDVVGASIDGAGVAGAGIGSVTLASSTTGIASIGTNNVLSTLTLSGNDTTVNVTGGNVVSADTLTLGNNTLNVTNGTFTIGNGAVQTVYVNLYADASKAGQIIASNGVTVGASTNVVISVDPTEYVADGTTYTIVDGNTGNGGVTTINSITGISSAMIKYIQDTTNTDDLIIRAVRTRLSSYVTSQNAINVANALDDIAMTGDDDVDSLQLAIQAQANAGNDDTVSEMMAALVSSADGGVMTSNLNVGSIIQDVHEGRIASIRLGDSDYNDGYYGGDNNYTPDNYYMDNDNYYKDDDIYYDSGVSSGAMVNGYSFWAQGYARDVNQQQNTSVSGYDAITYGMVFGIDTSELFEDTIFGVSFGYGKTSVKSRNANRTKTDVDNYGFSIYSNYDFNDNMFLDAQISYGYNSIESRRYNVGAGLLTALADYTGEQYLAKLATGYDMWLSNGMILTPVFSTSFAYLYNEGYEERNAGGLGLTVDSTHMSVLELGAGVKLAYKMQSLDGDAVLKPKLHAMYNYDLLSDRLENSSVFSGAPSVAFITEDADVTNERINLGLGVDYKTFIWTVSTTYDYEYRKDYSAHSAAVKLNLEF